MIKSDFYLEPTACRSEQVTNSNVSCPIEISFLCNCVRWGLLYLPLRRASEAPPGSSCQSGLSAGIKAKQPPPPDCTCRSPLSKHSTTRHYGAEQQWRTKEPRMHGFSNAQRPICVRLCERRASLRRRTEAPRCSSPRFSTHALKTENRHTLGRWTAFSLR